MRDRRWIEELYKAKPRGPVQISAIGDLPMRVLELAYEEYAHNYGTEQSLARLNERGGLSVGEVIGLLADLIERERESRKPVKSPRPIPVDAEANDG